MLNYIWTGLIALSLVFALGHDVRDITADRYRNNAELAVTLRFPKGYDAGAASVPVEVGIEAETYRSFYRTEGAPPGVLTGTLVQAEGARQVRFGKGAELPAPLATIRAIAGSDGELVADVRAFPAESARTGEASAQITFKPVRLVKLRAISQAAVDFAQTAVTVAIGLIGVLCLWLGLMRIAEKSGLIEVLVKVISPVLHPLFPEIPRGHPAMGVIALNLAANMLGVGNAATPFGIKAMEELQKLNKSEETASNSMVMLLAINTAGIQLMPPATLVALMGVQMSRIYFPVILVTGLSLVIAIGAAKLLGRLPVFARTNPDLLPPKPATT